MQALPAELLVSHLLTKLDARSLSRVAMTSSAVHKLASDDQAWRQQLQSQGMRPLGMTHWPHSLMSLFVFSDRLHEALEFEVASCHVDPQSPLVR